jgi:Domain of unknown function (DUF4124)
MKLLPILPLKSEHLIAALLLSGSLANLCALASTPIYKWKDEQGQTHYSDVAPPNKPTETLALVPLNLQQSLTKDIKTDDPETKATDDTKQTNKKQEQEDAKKTKAKGSLAGVQDSKTIKQPTMYEYPEYPGYYYPPYQYPHHQYPPRKPNRPTPCLYHGQGCGNLGRPDYAHKKHQRHNKKNRRNTAVSYPGFERPNLYWDPYSYSKASPRR